MIEVNISCPNVEDRGQVFACDPARLQHRGPGRAAQHRRGHPGVRQAQPGRHRHHLHRPGLRRRRRRRAVRINTLLGMVIDTDTLRPALAGVTGGLSGPAIRPVAVRCVYQVHAALPQVPILGMGGIRTGLDALQFVLAGASAVSVGTTVFGDPTAPLRVLAELEQALAERGIDRLQHAVGLAHPLPVERLPEGPDPVGDPAGPVPGPPPSDSRASQGADQERS
jgi:dihydroorotate dehydrogenase (NAD+) catalytic subunit